MNVEEIKFPTRNEFSYWFINIGDRKWSVCRSQDVNNTSLGTLTEQDQAIEIEPSSESAFNANDVDSAFRKFKERPEYYVYNFEHIYENSIFEDTERDQYTKLMTGCVFLRVPTANPKNLMSNIDKMLEWINGTDFYFAPASTRFHGCTPGGLVGHTLKVAYLVSKLVHTPIWENKVRVEDAIFTALVHDWCKINLYESYTKNVKNEVTGIWEKEVAYKVKDTPMSCLGHGVSSMFLASRFFKLSVEEAAAIRWHMGEYNVADNEMNDLHQANETYPMVQLLQFADRLSIVKYL